MKKQDFVNDYAQFMHIHIHTYIRTVWDTHLADYLEIIRAQSPVCRSAGPVGGYSGRPSVTAGRTCNTRSTPRGTPGRTPAASPDRSSWSSPCNARTSPRRSSRNRNGSRAWGRVWSTSATASRRIPCTRGTPRGNSSRPPSSRTCRRWCGRSRRKSSPEDRIPSSRKRTALRTTKLCDNTVND